MRPALLIAVLASLVAVSTPPPTTPPHAVVAAADGGISAIPLARIISSAQDAHRTVKSILDGLDDAELVAEVRQELPVLVTKIDPLLVDQGVTSRGDVTDQDRALRRADQKLNGWDRRLESAVEAAHEGKQNLQRMDETWAATEELAKQEQVPPAVLERVATVRATLRTASEHVQDRIAERLATQDQVASVRLRVADALARVQQVKDQEAAQLFEVGSVPLWRLVTRPPQPARTGNQILQELKEQGLALRDYLTAHDGRALVLLGTLLVLTVILWRGRRRLTPEADRDPDVAVGARVLEHPFASSALLTLTVGLLLFSQRPLVVSQFILFAMLLALLGAGSNLIPSRARRSAYALTITIAVYIVSSLLPELSLLRRLVLLAVSVAGTAVFVGELRGRAWETKLPTPGWRAVLRVGLTVGALLLTVAAVANLFGDVGLAQLLTTGTLGSASVLLLLSGVLVVVRALLASALASATVKGWPVIASQTERLRARLFRYLLFGTVLLWLLFTARFFTIADPIRAALRQFLSFHVQVGALDLSVADVFAFAITLWAAVVLARVVSFLLELGLENGGLARGVPAAISRTASYVIVGLGTVLAFLASGMELTRFTVVLGTLGVGIGFGLQNVVNNFVSGLILLYERPVQVGDIIEVGNVTGTVRRIGIRSSTVATEQGAEVVVPNGELISNRVTNWTLSQRRRRIDVDVKVPSDTAPEHVRALLVRVAAGNPAVLAKPGPEALLTSFSDGLQFQLRAWTDRSEDWAQVASELRTSISHALGEPSVEPPRTDVSLSAVEPSAAALETGKH